MYKPPSLLDASGKWFGAGRPQYEDYSPDQSKFIGQPPSDHPDACFVVLSVKAHGAVGDGVTDDTAAIQAIFDTYADCKIIFFDAGTSLYAFCSHI